MDEEHYSIDDLIRIAIEKGVEEKIVKGAMLDLDIDAIRALTQEFNGRIEAYLDDEYVYTIVKRLDTCDDDHAVKILEILADKDPYAVSILSNYKTPLAIELMRRKLEVGYTAKAAAEAIIIAVYDGNAVKALQDESEIVRYTATKRLENTNATKDLVEALSNSVAQVRRVATWYTGRNKVYEAVDILIDRLQVEQDIETLRAIIWSLGVMRVTSAKSYLKKLMNHDTLIIRDTIQDTLNKLSDS